MKDEDKTKDKLINELVELRQRINELEACETRGKEIEGKLAKGRNLLYGLMDNIPDWIFFKDAKSRFTRINRAHAHLLGITDPKEAVGKTDFDFFPREVAQRFYEEEKKVIRSGQPVVTRVGQTPSRDGEMLWVSETKVPLHNEKGEVVGLVGISRDITKLKQAEEELKEARSHFETLFNVVVDPVVIIDGKGKILEITNRVQEVTGFNREELVGKSFLKMNLLTAKSKAIAIKNLAKRIMGMKIAPYEVEVLTKGGKKISFEINAARIDYRGKPADMVVFHDLTERKKMEEALRETKEKFKGIAERSFDVICTMDREGRITYVSPAAERIIGYKPAEVVGKLFHDLLIESETPKLARYLNRVIKGEVIENLELTIRKKSGRRTYIEMNISPIFTGEHVVGFQGTFRDITYRKRAEEKIKASLKEKETLLREIHHRVKNNLQITSGLLSLQSQHLQDKQALEAFRESQNRIRSIALVHEQLYRSKGLATVNFAEYLQGLVVNLFDSYAVNSEIISLKASSPDIFLGIDTAIPCGLITHELTSNCLKYAFPKARKGEIHIDFRRDESNQFTLIVKDNGIGFPKNLDFRNTNTLGLQLVNVLVDQLDGSIELDRKGGTTFKITFGELRYKER